MLTLRGLLQCIASELIWLRIARGRALTRELSAEKGTTTSGSHDGERRDSRKGKILGFYTAYFVSAELEREG
jgi:hypothetical protein